MRREKVMADIPDKGWRGISGGYGVDHGGFDESDKKLCGAFSRGRQDSL